MQLSRLLLTLSGFLIKGEGLASIRDHTAGENDVVLLEIRVLEPVNADNLARWLPRLRLLVTEPAQECAVVWEAYLPIR